MSHDPAESNPDLYTVIFDNDRVRVLEYRDQPGDRTTPHRHPDSVMVTLASFTRRVASADRHVDVALDAGAVRWLDAQEHAGENIGTTPTHAIFVELKDPAGDVARDPARDSARRPVTPLGPAAPQP